MFQGEYINGEDISLLFNCIQEVKLHEPKLGYYIILFPNLHFMMHVFTYLLTEFSIPAFTFFHLKHTLICQRHKSACHKIFPHEKRYKTIHNHKYISTQKSLSCKNAGI